MLPLPAAWTVAIIAIVCRSLLMTGVALLLWGVLPNLVGFQTTTVMSGSMSPRLQVGDAVIVRHVDASELRPGQVLLFDDPDRPGALRMHRLVAVGADGRIVTKGDANRDKDSSAIRFDAVHGAGFLRIPYAGLPNYWIRTGQPVPLVAGAVLTVVLLGGVRLGRLLEDDETRARRRHRGPRLPGMHRAAAAGAVLLVLGGAWARPAEARAAYSGTTATSANAWATMCGDVAPSTGPTPSLYYGYGTGTTTVSDLSATADAGTLRSGASRVSTCANGWSPYATFNGTSGLINASVLRNHPTAVTVATWFRVSPGDAGGVLADFGNVGSSGPSGGIDDALYMGNSGSLTFGAASIQVLSLVQTAYVFCTTSAGYADGSWHLAVATMSSSGCTLTVDADPATTIRVASGLTVNAGAFSGYWRFGYDAVSLGANSPSRLYFKGALDETQVYDSAVAPPTAATPGVQGAIYARGHGGSIN